MKNTNQIRQLLEKIISRLCGDCDSDGCATQKGCPYKDLFHEITQALAVLPCETCNGTKKIPTAQSRGFGKENEIMDTCPDCQKSGVETKYISKEDVICLLMEWTSLRGKKKIDHIKPGHGPCCTCQTCGYHHDDCVCLHNELLDVLNSLPTIEK